MFPDGREKLWKEKLGLIPRFAGNAATRWGTNQEEQALVRSASRKSLLMRLCKQHFTLQWYNTSSDMLTSHC